MFSIKKAKKVKRRLNLLRNSRRVWRILLRNNGWIWVFWLRLSRSIIISPRQGRIWVSLFYFGQIFLAGMPWGSCHLSYHWTYWLAPPKDRALYRRWPEEVNSRWFWSPTILARDSLSRMTQTHLLQLEYKLINLSDQ